MKTLKIIGRVCSIIITLLAVLLLAFNLYTLAARWLTDDPQPDVFGFSTAVVISGSMSGSIEVNDMVVIRARDSYAVGDVVTFISGDSLVTHRIIGEEGDSFITRGDANNSPDPDLLHPALIVGKVVAVIPGIGRAIEFLRTPLGMTGLVLVGFALIEIPALLRRRSNGTGGETDEEQIS